MSGRGESIKYTAQEKNNCLADNGTTKGTALLLMALRLTETRKSKAVPDVVKANWVERNLGYQGSSIRPKVWLKALGLFSD